MNDPSACSCSLYYRKKSIAMKSTPIKSRGKREDRRLSPSLKSRPTPSPIAVVRFLPEQRRACQKRGGGIYPHSGSSSPPSSSPSDAGEDGLAITVSLWPLPIRLTLSVAHQLRTYTA